MPAMTRRLAIAAGGLFAIDLVTGLPFWSQWPLLCLALVWGWRAAPQLQRGRLSTGTIRALLAAAFFVGLNLFSPEGGAWSVWPAGAILGLAALLHLRKA